MTECACRGAACASPAVQAPASGERAGTVANFFAGDGAPRRDPNKPRCDHKVKVARGELLKANPSYAQPAYDVVCLCCEERPFDEVVASLRGGSYPKTFIAQPDAFATLLCDHGFLSLGIYVDGEPYPGTREELADDEQVGLDAEITYTLTSTEEGVAAVSALAPRRQLTRLLGQDPEAEPVYRRILTLASAEGGVSRGAIERALHDDGLIVRDERTGLVSIFPTYYIDNLERAGGLVWEGAWKTTREGREVLGG